MENRIPYLEFALIWNRLVVLIQQWKGFCTVHSSSSVQTREPTLVIASFVKKASEAFVDTTSTFTLSYCQWHKTLTQSIRGDSILTLRSSLTINGALTDATLPVVINRTCVPPGLRSASATKAISGKNPHSGAIIKPLFGNHFTPIVKGSVINELGPALDFLVPNHPHSSSFFSSFRAEWAIYYYTSSKIKFIISTSQALDLFRSHSHPFSIDPLYHPSLTRKCVSLP